MTRRTSSFQLGAPLFGMFVLTFCFSFGMQGRLLAAPHPHIVLVMADDQGWAQTGYYQHPVLKTPNLDAMAAGGLRFDRFYAGAPVCSPTRASVLTGRANDRTGVESHGYALRRQEITLAQILADNGYATGHFGKWHLNGLRGPGVPVLKSDDHNPGEFGFQTWLSVTNFFDRDPILSRQGTFEEFQGDSSEIVVEQAIRFIAEHHEKQPTFTVIWFGSPHNPFKATDQDMAPFDDLNTESRKHYGELVAMDRSIGTLLGALGELHLRENTLVWFCSDNGGLPKIEPSTVGNLRGNKGTIYEGGLRVPAIIQWPAMIKQPRITSYPATVLDILPTILDIDAIPYPDPDRPLDGISLLPLMEREIGRRERPIPFRYQGKAAWIDNDMKLLSNDLKGNDQKGNDRKVAKFELYDLNADPSESTNLITKRPDVATEMQEALLRWNDSVEQSVAGQDYPEGRVDPSEPAPRFWTDVDSYRPYFEQWKDRWEYQSQLNKR